MILFNSPNFSLEDEKNIFRVIKNKKFADGYFQNASQTSIKNMVKAKFVAMTQSGSDALEVASILLNLKKGDEVIMPSFTFSSTANSVLLRGAKPVFVDVQKKNLVSI